MFNDYVKNFLSSFFTILKNYFFSLLALITLYSLWLSVPMFQNYYFDQINFNVLLRLYLLLLAVGFGPVNRAAIIYSSLFSFGQFFNSVKMQDGIGRARKFRNSFLAQIGFSFLLCLLLFYYQGEITPLLQKRCKDIRRYEIMRLVDPESREGICFKSTCGATVYGKKWYSSLSKMDTVVVDYGNNGIISRRLAAERALWQGGWNLIKVTEYVPDKKNSFSKQEFESILASDVIETPEMINTTFRSSSEMSTNELRSCVQIIEQLKTGDLASTKVELALRYVLPYVFG